MNSDVTSLDRLHDIVLPAEVSWWPLAPGWYALLCIVLIVAVFFSFRLWRRWQADAYRRAALLELAKMKDVPAIAELFRRTALAVVPRSEVAQKTGSAWADWLAGHYSAPVPSEVHRLLSAGVYGTSVKEQEVKSLRNYASSWISNHMFSQSFTKKSGE